MEFSDLETLSSAFGESRVLHTAVELDLFSAIGAGASAAQVAAQRGLDPRATELLCNAMTALGLLHKADGTFSLTEAARRYLLPGAPEYFGGMVALEAAGWDMWGRLPAAIESGAPQRPQDMFQDDPEETRRFILAMDSLVKARGDHIWLAGNLDMTGVTRLLDVGSGPGTYPIALCRAHEGVSATLFDLPGTLEVTREVIERDGYGLPIHLIEGDYRADPLPDGFDLILLSNVIHLENEADNLALLKKCRGALNPGGRLVIKDHIVEADRVHPPGAAVFALMMLLATRGRVYSLDEVSGWLLAAGFDAPTEQVLPSPFSSSLVTARAADSGTRPD